MQRRMGSQTADQKVDIVLPMYNGTPFLVEQLDSLLCQSYGNFNLFAIDDASTDGTVELFKNIVSKAGRGAYLEVNEVNRGIIDSLNSIICKTQAPYIMLCDQDDIWEREKVKRALSEIEKLEARLGTQTPILVYTDLKVVNSEGSLIAESYMRYMSMANKPPERLGRIVMQNRATGCACIFNRSLKDLAFPVPAEAIMHDWWLFLVASVFGTAHFCPDNSTRYRQHEKNSVGAVQPGRRLKRFMGSGFDIAGARRTYRSIRRQAEAFLQRYSDALPDPERTLLEEFVSLSECSFLKRRYFLIKNGFLKDGLLRNLLLMATAD
ncbi:MAG: glycosyltransferase family 2 protein [Deltaproteobacteria bacterium]|nr:MAG: glycosyltransferase family 2 protein [Deltaproteobacteria bacterium]